MNPWEQLLNDNKWRITENGNTFIINLREQYDRWNFTYNHLKSLGFEPSKFIAVDKEYIDENKVFLVSNKIVSNTLPINNIGCALSHMILCLYIIETRMPYIIVFEDDAILTNSYKNDYIDLIQNVLTLDFDMIYLGMCREKCYQLRSQGTITKLYHASSPACGHAYILSYKGALKLLQNWKCLNSPLDQYRKHLIEKRILNVYVLHPTMFKQNLLFNTDFEECSCPRIEFFIILGVIIIVVLYILSYG